MLLKDLLMAKTLLWSGLLCIVCAIVSCSEHKSTKLIYERLSTCQGGEYDSSVLCGKFAVFENTQSRQGRKIDLNIVVIPAIHENKQSPIFFFEGGPGIGVTVGGSFYADSINYYRVNHDVVLVDVRGTGNSNPLHCRQLQYGQTRSGKFDEMYPGESVKACYDSLSKIADLTQYTTTNMAMDIEEVRIWLGYDKIKLFGLSFGTRLAQVYMKMYPGSVESCVLQSPTTTYSKLPLYHAKFAEEAIDKLFNDCANDSTCANSFPGLKEKFQDLARRGKEESVEYNLKTSTGDGVRVTIPWFAFETKVRSMMYSPAGLRKLPFIISESYAGNWTPFLELFPAKSEFNNFLAEGLYLCVTCAEDVPYISNGEVDSLTRGTFGGDYRVRQQINACSHWARGQVPDHYFEPLKSDIPTLIISGTFDPVTPPSMAKQILKTLSKGFLIEIPTMSHVFEGLSNPECFDKMVVDFYDNPTRRPDADCIGRMLPEPYATGK